MLIQKGEHTYGDEQADLEEVIAQYSETAGYTAEHFAHARCACESTAFNLYLDDTEGCAVRVCAKCEEDQFVGDSEQFIEGASLDHAQCVCGKKHLELTVGVALYEGSEDVRWLYLAARCVECGLAGVYGDWKNEYNGYKELLNRV